MTLLALLAIPSFVAFCFLAIIHTLQTTTLRLAANAPFPSEALLQEYFPAAPAFRASHSVATRARSYERVLQTYASRSTRFAFAGRDSDPGTFLRMPFQPSFPREYRRNMPDYGFRNMANPEARYKSSAAQAIFPRHRTRLSAVARRPRSVSTAIMSYSQVA